MTNMKILTVGTFSITRTWTNWTFGIWWARFKPTNKLGVGIDIGPLELWWKEK